MAVIAHFRERAEENGAKARNNPANVVKATLGGLRQLRLREDIYRGRGLAIRSAPKPPPPVETPVAPAPVEAAVPNGAPPA